MTSAGCPHKSGTPSHGCTAQHLELILHHYSHENGVGSGRSSLCRGDNLSPFWGGGEHNNECSASVCPSLSVVGEGEQGIAERREWEWDKS